MVEGDEKGCRVLKWARCKRDMEGLVNGSGRLEKGSQGLQWWRQEYWADSKWKYNKRGGKIVQLSELRSVRKL